MSEYTDALERTVLIGAPRELVFQFFADSSRWARWWGAGSTIDAQPGGRVYIRYPNGVEALGKVLESVPPERISFTYGYASGKPVPPEASRVIIRLEAEGSSTRLHLRHEFTEATARDEHVQGWRFQLSLFSNLVADEVHAGAAEIVDRWFASWVIKDDRARAEAFASIASPAIVFHDRFSALAGLEDLTTHAGAAQRFMPGVVVERRGEILHCQGTVLVNWAASGTDGKERFAGTNVFALNPEGRIESVTAFSNPGRVQS
jgi:uncharacterized protein YndB with AHSA1/START domain